MPVSAPELSEALSQVVESVGKSVVRVEGGRRAPTSGVVISPNRIVTVARGVFRDEVMVGLDGVSLKARVKGLDRSTDLALLEVDGSLPAVSLDDGLHAKVGQIVLKLARPGQTVQATSGASAGIQYGDTLLHLGDDSVKTLEDLTAWLRADHVGEQVPAKVWRQGKVETLAVTLGARP
jgi:S1-C subfamily serine protease